MKNITDGEFKEAVSSGTVLVDFWATWCGPCMMQGKILETLPVEGFSIIKADVDKCKETAKEFGIKSVPTIIIFKDGKETKRFTGLQKKEVLMEAMK